MGVKSRGIGFNPDEADPKRVTLTRGLSGDISKAEITYRVEGGFMGSRVVCRSAAAFAQLRTTGGDRYVRPWSRTEILTLDEAGRFIEQARARIRAQDDEVRRRTEAVDLTCSCCGRDRTYIGVIGFITGETAMLSDRPSEMGQQVISHHAYRCGCCGSMQLFADGFLPHPLPGRVSGAAT